MKQYVHLLAPLVLWVIGLALYIVTISNDIPKRVDTVKTYRIHKKPHSFDDAMYGIRDSFLANWINDDCYKITNFTSDATCKTKRTALKTKILDSMECTAFPSEACNCVTEITKGIVDSTGNYGKNLGGWKEATMYGIESCRWLMHNAHTAVFTGKIWAQKTGILLMILTLVTGNAFDWVMMNYWLKGDEMDNTSRSIIKAFVLFLWGMVSLIISVVIDSSTYMVFTLILLPPIIILVLYELYKGSYPMPDRPFIHPYVFCCVLGALTFLAHAEMGILDFDILTYEIFKCNVASYIYLQAVWKYMIKNPQTDVSDSNYVEEGTLRSVILVFLLYVVGIMAPYPLDCETVVMWYLPLLWVVFGFASVVWVRSFYYNEFFGVNAVPLTPKHWVGEISAANRHVSTIQMIFIFLLLMYYLRENSTVFRLLIDNYPTVTMQYNSSVSWQHPPALVSR
jgi:hypothetical protein